MEIVEKASLIFDKAVVTKKCSEYQFHSFCIYHSDIAIEKLSILVEFIVLADVNRLIKGRIVAS